jgi:predicted nuclease of predicted toxin-antitoxin system
MKFIVDECVGKRVCNWLRSMGHQVLDVLAELKGIDDRSILKIAAKQKMTLITMDKDFGRLVYHERMEHNGVILFRDGDATVNEMKEYLSDLFQKPIRSFENKFITIRGSRPSV